MEIFIQHQDQQTGPFSPQEIQAGLASGLYQISDLVWAEGMDGWIPLSNAPHILGTAPQLPSVVPAENSGLAITSMILGISGFFCGGLTAIPAVICGHSALGKIKQSQGRLTGGGFAIAGLITGYISLVIFMIAILAALTAPMVIKQRNKAVQAEAISNARAFYYSLIPFEEEYGSFPNAATAPLVADNLSVPAITGDSSNARFRQLFQAGMVESEEVFYAKAAGTHKPDGVFSGDNALAPGECGFGYIENVRRDDGASRPIVMTPFKLGSDKFDITPFGGKAVVLFSDGSVQSLPIDRTTGHAILDGQNLLDPNHPIWGGTPPSLLLPE